MLLEFNVAHCLTEAIFCAQMLLLRIRDLGEESPLLVVVVGSLVVHDDSICAVHLLVNEVTIESELFHAYFVSACIEGLAHLLLFFCLLVNWLLAGIIPGVATSPFGPFNKVYELLNILRRLIFLVLFCEASLECLFEVPLRLVDQIYVTRLEFRSLLFEVVVERLELVSDRLRFDLHERIVVLIHDNLTLLAHRQVLQEILRLDVLHLKIRQSMMSFDARKVSWNACVLALAHKKLIWLVLLLFMGALRSGLTLGILHSRWFFFKCH